MKSSFVLEGGSAWMEKGRFSTIIAFLGERTTIVFLHAKVKLTFKTYNPVTAVPEQIGQF